MPSFNNAQLAAFLNALHEPARLYDVRGNLVAENLPACTVEWPDEDGDGKNIIHTFDLGEGWFIRRMSVTCSPSAPSRLSGQSVTRPNLQALMSGITHELRNPLAAILTATSLLQDDSGLHDETVMLLDVVRKEARRMNQILTEFSLYVKLPQPHPIEFDLSEMARRTIEELKRNGILRENTKIENHLIEPLTVSADPIQIQQVLHRLLENAAYALANQTDGVIILRSYAQTDTSRVVLCIEDNGPGFSSDELQQAFLPFYSTKPQGVGLGLSIAQVAVQAADGEIWIENLTGKNAPPLTKTETIVPSVVRICFALPSNADK